MLLCVVAIVTALPREKRFKYEYEKGKVWMHPDFYAPFSFAIEKTPEELEADRQEVLNDILPVYRKVGYIGERNIESFKRSFDLLWKSKYASNPNRSSNLKAGLQLLEEFYNTGIIDPAAGPGNRKRGNSLTLVENNVAGNVNLSALYTHEKALAFANVRLEKYAETDKDFLMEIIEDHLQPNVIFDEALTTKLEQEALSSISQKRGLVQKGELIVRKGSVVTDEVYQRLNSIKNQYQRSIIFSGDRRIIMLGQFLLVATPMALIMLFLYYFRRDVFKDYRKLLLVLLIVAVILSILSWILKTTTLDIYLIPYCIVPIIIRLLFDSRMALNIHLLVVTLAGFLVPNGFEFVFLQVTAGMTAIYSIRNLLRRSQFLLSSLLILLTYYVAFLGLSITHEGSFQNIEWQKFLIFMISVVLSLLAYPLIYLFEKLFGITSEITLMELTNTNSPILRDLAFNAPGTFQHSLQVANLAEAAIYKIGGNALLVRAGALYHDIGKMKSPSYFKENQNKGYNPHDKLTYDESARIIIRHVTDGIAMARKKSIPEDIVNFIQTHHGTTRVDYFYQSFLKNFPDRIMDEQIFRYPGPIPFTKEQAVLMLADSVEAASRSLKEPNATNIESLVDRIVDYKIEQNQLVNSDITLRDIATIRSIFKEMLISIYHARIEYPKAASEIN
ncbi:HD family phosphohydrolase [Anseongella ginsenosidimutans]|nr:HDIG domain-containing metalloprotein [Anseongella ginsenosidimutans]QEC52990.1 HDIG domain-containing protein [Anseongella ginsenosidimutans]